MILWSPLRQKLQSFWYRSFQKRLPHVTAIVVLVAIFLVYSYSISHDRLSLVGATTGASRFLIAMEYARDPSKALILENPSVGNSWVSWLGIWPPVPFIIQGFVLRLVLFPGMSDASTGIMAVKLTSAVLVLLGFYFIGRSVALQTDEPTGLLACLMCFSAPAMLYIAYTTLSEVYAFFFVSLAIWNLFRFITRGKGLAWSVLSFALAFFCRSESLVMAFVAGVFLLAHRQWRPAAAIVSTVTVLAFSKMLGAILLVEDEKFFEYDKVLDFDWQDKLKNALWLVRKLLSLNKQLILLSFVCALPLIYYAVKRRNSPKAGKIGNDQDSTKESPPATSRRAGFVVWLTKTYRQLGSWVVRVPVAFWAASFLIAIGVLLAAALRGNMVPMLRYLSMANVFMTTAIALLVAQAVRTLYASRGKFAKQVALGIITVLVLFSLWSGFSHATGRKVAGKMSPQMKDVVHFIREHNVQGDRVAFDFLQFQGKDLAAQLLDPSLETPTQFLVKDDREITSFLPEKVQVPSERKVALTHAFIHSKRPRFLVLVSDQLYESMNESMKEKNRIRGIRRYLSPVEGTEAAFVFQSPYVLPEVEIPFTKVHENDSYIILERGYSQENRRQ